MYRKGDVFIGKEDEYGYCSTEYLGQACLPHSCNEWVIGGKKEVELLIADLQEILKQIK